MADPEELLDSPSTAAPVELSLNEPEIEALMERFRLPPDEAQRILDRLTLTLLAKRGRIRDPRRWLRRALRRQCVDWWRRRRRLLARVLDTGLATLLSTADLRRDDRRLVLEELERNLATLRPECRRLLARRYGLKLEGEDGDPAGGEDSTVDRHRELACVEALARQLGPA